MLFVPCDFTAVDRRYGNIGCAVIILIISSFHCVMCVLSFGNISSIFSAFTLGSLLTAACILILNALLHPDIIMENL